MEITITQQNDVNALLTVNISEQDYADQYKKRLRELAAKGQFKGFRPGKVPVQHVERMYGLSVRVDAVNDVLGKSVDDYIRDNNISILGNPLPSAEEKSVDFRNDRDYTFVFELGLVPQFDAPKLADIKVETYSIEVNDENVEQTLQNLRKRFGERIVPETTAAGDELYGDLVKQDGSTLKTMLPTDKVAAKAIAQFVGKKIGDTITFDLSKALDAHQIQHFAGLTKEEAAAAKGDVQFTITNINRQAEAELNQDFFKKVFPAFPEDGTLETFTAQLREEVAKAYADDSNHYYQEAFRKALMKQVKVDLPESFLKRWLLATNDNLTEEEADKNLKFYFEDLRWTLVRDNIMTKQLELTPSFDMVVEHLTQSNLNMLKMYGLGAEDEQAQGLAKEMALRHLREDNGKNWNRASQEAFTAIFYANARKHVNLVDKSISLNEFEDKMHHLLHH